MCSSHSYAHATKTFFYIIELFNLHQGSTRNKRFIHYAFASRTTWGSLFTYIYSDSGHILQIDILHLTSIYCKFAKHKWWKLTYCETNGTGGFKTAAFCLALLTLGPYLHYRDPYLSMSAQVLIGRYLKVVAIMKFFMKNPLCLKECNSQMAQPFELISAATQLFHLICFQLFEWNTRMLRYDVNVSQSSSPVNIFYACA